MSRRRDKGRLAPFVPLLKETIATPAWRAMSPSARCVYIALKQRYSSNFKTMVEYIFQSGRPRRKLA